MPLTINLPASIKSREEAVKYLTLLHETGYAYHCDDSVHDGTPEGGVIWSLKPEDERPTWNEQIVMDLLMEQVFKYLPDPCQVLCDLEGISGWTVQKLIDELMEIKDKDRPILIFNMKNGNRGELKDVDLTMRDVVELNVEFFD